MSMSQKQFLAELQTYAQNDQQLLWIRQQLQLNPPKPGQTARVWILERSHAAEAEAEHRRQEQQRLLHLSLNGPPAVPPAQDNHTMGYASPSNTMRQLVVMNGNAGLPALQSYQPHQPGSVYASVNGYYGQAHAPLPPHAYVAPYMDPPSQPHSTPLQQPSHASLGTPYQPFVHSEISQRAPQTQSTPAPAPTGALQVGSTVSAPPVPAASVDVDDNVAVDSSSDSDIEIVEATPSPTPTPQPSAQPAVLAPGPASAVSEPKLAPASASATPLSAGPSQPAGLAGSRARPARPSTVPDSSSVDIADRDAADKPRLDARNRSRGVCTVGPRLPYDVPLRAAPRKPTLSPQPKKRAQSPLSAQAGPSKRPLGAPRPALNRPAAATSSSNVGPVTWSTIEPLLKPDALRQQPVKNLFRHLRMSTPKPGPDGKPDPAAKANPPQFQPTPAELAKILTALHQHASASYLRQMADSEAYSNCFGRWLRAFIKDVSRWEPAIAPLFWTLSRTDMAIDELEFLNVRSRATNILAMVEEQDLASRAEIKRAYKAMIAYHDNVLKPKNRRNSDESSEGDDEPLAKKRKTDDKAGSAVASKPSAGPSTSAKPAAKVAALPKFGKREPAAAPARPAGGTSLLASTMNQLTGGARPAAAISMNAIPSASASTGTAAAAAVSGSRAGSGARAAPAAPVVKLNKKGFAIRWADDQGAVLEHIRIFEPAPHEETHAGPHGQTAHQFDITEGRAAAAQLRGRHALDDDDDEAEALSEAIEWYEPEVYDDTDRAVLTEDAAARLELARTTLAYAPAPGARPDGAEDAVRTVVAGPSTRTMTLGAAAAPPAPAPAFGFAGPDYTQQHQPQQQQSAAYGAAPYVPPPAVPPAADIQSLLRNISLPSFAASTAAADPALHQHQHQQQQQQPAAYPYQAWGQPAYAPADRDGWRHDREREAPAAAYGARDREGERGWERERERERAGPGSAPGQPRPPPPPIRPADDRVPGYAANHRPGAPFRRRPCKFWNEGSCRAGDECTFIHVGPPGRPRP
ncbi:hypothetical protein Q5752_006615 [Cryptotrichosporon argae]